MKSGAWLLLVASLLLMASCAADVLVVDEAGAPVEGATVTPIAPSANGTPVVTDHEGRADLPRGIFRWEAVAVQKTGYEGIPYLKTGGNKPVRAILRHSPR